jgi:hypothetical protein
MVLYTVVMFRMDQKSKTDATIWYLLTWGRMWKSSLKTIKIHADLIEHKLCMNNQVILDPLVLLYDFLFFYFMKMLSVFFR